MGTIYDEAIADARKIRELAEQSARNAIIDAALPRIKALVDSRLGLSSAAINERATDDDDKLLLGAQSDDDVSDVSACEAEAIVVAKCAVCDGEGHAACDQCDGCQSAHADACPLAVGAIHDASCDANQPTTPGESQRDRREFVVDYGALGEITATVGAAIVDELGGTSTDVIVERATRSALADARMLINAYERAIMAASDDEHIDHAKFAIVSESVRSRLLSAHAGVLDAYDTGVIDAHVRDELTIRLESANASLSRLHSPLSRAAQAGIDDVLNHINAFGGKKHVAADRYTRVVDEIDAVRSIMQKMVNDPRVSAREIVIVKEGLDRATKELTKMATNAKTSRGMLREDDLEFKLKLGGMPEDLDADDVDVELTPADDKDVEDEDAETAEDEDAEGSDAGNDDASADELDLDDFDLDLDSDEDDDKRQDQGATVFENDDELVEIDEGMLKRELRKMQLEASQRRRTRATLIETKKRRRAVREMDSSVLDDFGGGKVVKLPTKLSEADDDELDDSVDEVRRQRARREAALKQEARAELRKLTRQVDELSLFNAKLLYANKLLQNEGLSSGQKAKIVRSLDRATTIREVKLMYRGLVESLAPHTASDDERGTVNENVTRRFGSASRPTRSGGAPVNDANATQTERWATLAGLVK